MHLVSVVIFILHFSMEIYMYMLERLEVIRDFRLRSSLCDRIRIHVDQVSNVKLPVSQG